MGSFTKCDDAPINNGYVLLYQNNRTLISVLDNGAFQFSTLVCDGSATFELEGIDTDDIQTTGRIAYNFTSPATIITNLKACNTLSEFISLKVDNDPIEIIHNNFATVSNHPSQAFMVQGNLTIPSLSSVTLYTALTAVDTYTIDDPLTRIILRYNLNHDPTGSIISLGSLEINSLSGITCNVIINKYGDVGDYIDARFSGSFIQYGILHQVDGLVHVKRQ
jgi:hypothetical protein